MTAKKKPKAKAKPKKVARTAMCEHRIPPESYCSRCDS